MNKYNIFVFTFLLFISISFAYESVSFSFQGTDVANKITGNLLSGGDLEVFIYDNQTGGNLVWSEYYSNSVNNGSWNVMLGFNQSNLLELNYLTSYYIDYEIDGEDFDFTLDNGTTVERIIFQSSLGNNIEQDWYITKETPSLIFNDTNNNRIAGIIKEDQNLTITNTVRTDGGNNENTILILTFDSDYTDSSEGAGTNDFTNSGCTIDTTTKYFGTASLNTGVGNDYIYIADNNYFDWSSGEFSIDFWIKRTTTGLERIYGNLASDGSETDTSIYTYFNSGNTIKVRLIEDDGTRHETESTGTIIDTNWHHLAFVRDGDTFRLYIDGVQDGTDDLSGVTLKNPTNQFSFGRNGEYNGNYFDGNIDEIRINKGVIPDDYRGGTGFTLPTSAYTGYSYEEKTMCISNFTSHQFGNGDYPVTIDGSTIDFKTNNNFVARFTASGDVGVGTLTPSAMFEFDGSAGKPTALRFANFDDDDITLMDFSASGGLTVANYPYTFMTFGGNNYIDRLSSGNARIDAHFDVLTGDDYIATNQLRGYYVNSDITIDIPNNAYEIQFRNATNGNMVVIDPDSTTTLWVLNNVSATGYITRTSVFDKTKGKALDYIKDSDYYKDINGKIDHTKFYGFTEYEVRDYSRPEIIEEKGKKLTIYPYSITEQGVSLDEEINLLRQAIYEQQQTIKNLEDRIKTLESEK